MFDVLVEYQLKAKSEVFIEFADYTYIIYHFIYLL